MFSSPFHDGSEVTQSPRAGVWRFGPSLFVSLCPCPHFLAFVLKHTCSPRAMLLPASRALLWLCHLFGCPSPPFFRAASFRLKPSFWGASGLRSPERPCALVDRRPVAHWLLLDLCYSHSPMKPFGQVRCPLCPVLYLPSACHNSGQVNVEIWVVIIS